MGICGLTETGVGDFMDGRSGDVAESWVLVACDNTVIDPRSTCWVLLMFLNISLRFAVNLGII